MTNNNQDSLARIELFLAELTKLSNEIGVRIGDGSRTNCIIANDSLDGRYTLENSHCFGFEHSKGV